MKEVYGEFCSKQMDAAQLYKDLLKNDRKFSTFIKVCVANINPCLCLLCFLQQ